MHARAGVPPELVRRATEPHSVAAAIAHQIERGKGGAIGAANALGRLAGRFAPGLLLRAMRETPPRGARPSPGTVFITGVANGIGRALAQRYARAGWHVQGADVDAGRAQALMRELNQPLAEVLAVDLSNDVGVEQVIDWLRQQRPEVVIHNAGINAVGRFGDLPWKRQQQVLQVNLFAPLRVARALAEQVPATQQVFISSLSRYVGYPGAAVYAATKDGVAQYAYCLAAAGLRTLTVFPGPTRTQHASRYSPDNSREGRRMLPAALADAIFSAQTRGVRMLIPGIGNRLFALTGTLLPGLVERAMKRALLDRVQQPLT
jgi:short-subunit dehydrogenase